MDREAGRGDCGGRKRTISSTKLGRNGPGFLLDPVRQIWELLRGLLQRGSGCCLLHSGTEKTQQATPSPPAASQAWGGLLSCGCCLVLVFCFLTKCDDLESTRTQRGHSRALLILSSARILFKELPVLLGEWGTGRRSKPQAKVRALILLRIV